MDYLCKSEFFNKNKNINFQVDDYSFLYDNEDEKKLGSAIYDLFENYSLIFPDSNNNKFNKNIILFELREMTNLSTKEIRISIKKFKKLYFDLVQEILKD